MNLHFTFSVREISEIADDEQTLRIPMYLSVEWEVTLKRDFSYLTLKIFVFEINSCVAG